MNLWTEWNGRGVDKTAYNKKTTTLIIYFVYKEIIIEVSFLVNHGLPREKKRIHNPIEELHRRRVKEEAKRKWRVFFYFFSSKSHTYPQIHSSISSSFAQSIERNCTATEWFRFLDGDEGNACWKIRAWEDAWWRKLCECQTRQRYCFRTIFRRQNHRQVSYLSS